jgi:hypothetical protein
MRKVRDRGDSGYGKAIRAQAAKRFRLLITENMFEILGKSAPFSFLMGLIPSPNLIDRDLLGADARTLNINSTDRQSLVGDHWPRESVISVANRGPADLRRRGLLSVHRRTIRTRAWQ